MHLHNLWDLGRMQWRKLKDTHQCGVFSLAEEALTRRLFKIMSCRAIPPLVFELSWNSWKWKILRPFLKPRIKDIYLRLQK